MRVAVAIVLHGLALHRFLGQLAGELDRRFAAGKHADLEADSARRASPSLTSARNSRASSCRWILRCPSPRSLSAMAR